MTTTHGFCVTGTCPHGGKDEYVVTVTPPENHALFAEKALQHAEALLQEPIYQEVFTVRLANQLGCRVVTKCGHVGDRVQTTCEAHPGDPMPQGI